MARVQLPHKGSKIIAGIGEMRLAVLEQGLAVALEHVVYGAEPRLDGAMVINVGRWEKSSSRHSSQRFTVETMLFKFSKTQRLVERTRSLSIISIGKQAYL